MIALPSDLPLLRVGSCEISSYEPEWVASCISEAAKQAGHNDWWFATDIARSLMIYLRNRFPGTAITLEEMTARLQHTLAKIGFVDISIRVRLTPPLLHFSLDDLAREAEGFELRFFQLLDSRITELRGLGARHIAITASRRGVKHLRSVRHWTRSCEALQKDIANFVATRVRALDDGCAIELHAA